MQGGAVKQTSLSFFLLAVFAWAGVTVAADTATLAKKSTLRTSDIPAEYAAYRYELVMSKDDKVCKHMGEVYNNKFKRIFDYRKFSVKEVYAIPPVVSKYPTSEEFEVVPWRHPTIFTD